MKSRISMMALMLIRLGSEHSTEVVTEAVYKITYNLAFFHHLHYEWLNMNIY